MTNREWTIKGIALIHDARELLKQDKSEKAIKWLEASAEWLAK